MMCKDFTHWNKLRSWVHSIIFNRPTISSALEYRQFSYSGELFSYPLHEIDEIINRLGLLKNQHKPCLQTHLRQRLPPKWSPLIGRLPGLAPFIWQMTAIYSKCGTFLKIKILLVEFRGYFPLEGPTFLLKYLFFIYTQSSLLNRFVNKSMAIAHCQTVNRFAINKTAATK